MNLTLKAKVSLRMLKSQHLGGRFESHMKKIRILIPESVSEGEKVNFGLMIRIPKVVIRIIILESFLNNKKVEFGLVIRITKEVIRIPSVKTADKS